MSEPIKFDCEIRQVKTMADKTINITINLPEYQSKAAAELISHIGELAAVAILLMPVQE